MSQPIRFVTGSRAFKPLLQAFKWISRPKPFRFVYHGFELESFYHWYNATWRNERCIEVPIAVHAAFSVQDGTILEVGNVLSHYVQFRHDIVDKYEVAPNVTNIDILDHVPKHLYDLILCVSTLEHIGWEEESKDATGGIKVYEKMQSWLTPTGRLLVTVPLGCNPTLDAFVKSKEFACFYRKTPNGWIQTSESEDESYHKSVWNTYANVVAILDEFKGKLRQSCSN